MANRPRGSWISIIHATTDTGMGIHSARKLNRMNADLDDLKTQLRKSNDLIIESTDLTLKEIRSVGELQIITMSNLVIMDKKLDKITKLNKDLLTYFKNKDEQLSFLKGTILEIDKEIKSILNYSKHYPEYAIIQLEALKELITYHGITPEKYNMLNNLSDVERSKNILNSVDILLFEFKKSLGA